MSEKPSLVLSDFIEIVSKSGNPKVTQVAQIKNRGDYSPATDFYKPLREAIIALHKKEGKTSELNNILRKITDHTKLSHYPPIITAYQKWCNKKKLTWFNPPTGEYTSQGVEVVVNPQLGLNIGDMPHIIKLHFNTSKLSKARADISVGLMEMVLREKTTPNTQICILDIRHGRMFYPPEKSKTLKALIDSELAYIATLWDQL